MSKPDRREILSRVAAGTMTPEEAASELNASGGEEDQVASTVRKVRVVRQLGTLEVVGDSTVRDAVAEGPHRARLDGDVMIFEGEAADEWGGFVFGTGRHAVGEKLVIRLNPSLSLDLQLQAGSCRVRGVEGPIHASIQAGSATIDGFRGELELSVQAGSVKASGRLDHGDSRVSCDAGSVNLNLERGSSVRMTAHSTMGKVELPEAARAGNRGGHEVVIGEGAATLAIDTNMGSVKVSAEQ